MAKSDTKKAYNAIYKEYLIAHPTTKGKGLPKKSNSTRSRIVEGRGLLKKVEVKERPTTNRWYKNGKYIDLNKLKNNILVVKYLGNDVSIAQIRTATNISDDARAVIQDITEDKFNNRLFRQLPIHEKRLIVKLCSAMNLDCDLSDEDLANWNKRFQILKGEWLAGNDNKVLINNLKQYVMEGLRDGKIPRAEANQLLYQLNIQQ
jgi:hypothetical protein